MWPFGKATCEACGQVAAKRSMRFSPRERGFGVCRECVQRWEAKGRRCARCQHEVKPHQQLALFREPKGFGHFDCGGTPI